MMLELSARDVRQGLRFGKLLVLGVDGKNKHGSTTWRCICNCGGESVVPGKDLVSGNSKSCGCGQHRTGVNHPLWSGFGEISGFYLSQLRQRSIERNKRGRDSASEFSVTAEFLWDLFLRQDRKCALSGLSISFAPSSKTRGEQTASLDRIDSSKGYIHGNVQWVHKLINQMKMNLSDSDFIELCRNVAENNTKEDAK